MIINNFLKLLISFQLIIASDFLHAQNKSIKIKDLVSVKGVRENPLIGYGLVVGLNGTGDGGGEITSSSMKKMFQTLGLDSKTDISSKNVAAVIVTGSLPAFARSGQGLDVNVAAIGNASSLAGGTLLVTPLKAGDGNIYAIASGQLSIGGLSKGSKFATSARIPSGGVVEKDVEINFDKKNSLRLSLHQPDFTTAARVAKIINQELNGKYANAKDASTIDLIIPDYYQNKVVELFAIVENFRVIPDTKSKIIINERTGTIVAGGEIVIKPVALSHRDISIKVKDKAENPQFVHLLKQSTTLDELVSALNAIGATPEDLISIFQALHKNGALSAEIELI